MAIITASAPTSLPPSGTAGGDLGGTYPNPTTDLNTAGGTMAGAVTIAPAAGVTNLTLTGLSGDSTNLINAVATHTTFYVDSDGSAEFVSDDAMFVGIRGTGGTRAALRVREANNNEVKLESTGGLQLYDAGSRKVQITPGTMNFQDFTSDPATLLGSSAFAFWLDATPAATLLRIVAKDSAGTVKRAVIALA